MRVHNEILRVIARNCIDFGVEEAAVYQKAGVDPAALDLPDGMQDWRVGVRIWESALALTRYRYISLSFGENVTFSALGLIAPLTASGSNLAQAWQSFVDFWPLMGDMYTYQMQFRKNGSVRVCYTPAPLWAEASPLTAALATEHAMSLTLSLSAYLCGRIIEPVSTLFCHDIPVSDRSLFRKLYGNVEFGQPENALVFDAATAALPLISSNKLVYDDMRRLCADRLQLLKQRTDYTSRVTRLLAEKRAYYAPQLPEVAAMLNLSPRTLQRKLGEEGSHYQQILQNYQIDLATELLRRPQVQVQEVAFLLGFNSLASFSRAFRRKTGLSPTQVQAGQS